MDECKSLVDGVRQGWPLATLLEVGSTPMSPRHRHVVDPRHARSLVGNGETEPISARPTTDHVRDPRHTFRTLEPCGKRHPLTRRARLISARPLLEALPPVPTNHVSPHPDSPHKQLYVSLVKCGRARQKLFATT